MLRRSPPASSFSCYVQHLLFTSTLLFVFHAILFPSCSLALRPAVSDRAEPFNVTESNVTESRPREGSFADMIDRALEHEFTENDQNEGS